MTISILPTVSDHAAWSAVHRVVQAALDRLPMDDALVHGAAMVKNLLMTPATEKLGPLWIFEPLPDGRSWLIGEVGSARPHCPARELNGLWPIMLALRAPKQVAVHPRDFAPPGSKYERNTCRNVLDTAGQWLRDEGLLPLAQAADCIEVSADAVVYRPVGVPIRIADSI